MKFGIIHAMAAALFLSSPAIAQGIVQIRVDDGFYEGSINVNGYGKGYEYRWVATRMKGQIAVCGAGIFVDASSAVGMRRILRKMKITMDGKLLVKDLSFFAQVGKWEDISQATANCKLTGVPAPKSNDVDLDVIFPSGGVRF